MTNPMSKACGCKANRDGSIGPIGIVYCPLHASAVEMLEALKDQHRSAVGHMGGWTEYHRTPCHFCDIIAQAEGKES